MALALSIFTFALDRVRTVLLAVSVIILLKTALILFAPAITG